MKIEFLYFDGCPSYKIAFQYLNEVLEEENIGSESDYEHRAEIEKIKVKSEEEAKRLKFLGSPSIRINGKDLDQNSQIYYRFRCRSKAFKMHYLHSEK